MSACSSSSTTQERPLLERFELFSKGCFGRDMTIKSVIFVLKIWMLHMGASEQGAVLAKKMKRLISSLVECRQLYNQWKCFGSIRLSLKTLVEKSDTTTAMSLFMKICTVLTFWFRTWEQWSGDMGYHQRVLFYDSWSQPRIAWHYKFNKSISYTFNSIVQIHKILTLEKKIAAMKKQKRESTKSTNHTNGYTNGKIINNHKGEVQTELDSDEVFSLRQQKHTATLFLLRGLFDMVCYYQWIPWYRPWRHIDYISGLFSGLIGMQIAWETTSAVLSK